MADTNQKSKTSNTFRFQSFADRVSEIDIRRLALYHIGHENEELPEDNETYFHQTLKKWTVLNLTDEFGSFSRKCMRIVTLPQLIHQKDFVVDLLLERLSTATNLSLQPLLELLYVLARDLRDEFYPYFQRVLDRLICLLNTQDADQLEWTLVCLAHLFKTLKPYLKRNIGVVFHAILPLLDEQRYEEHVINFAVECFSFIARDIKDFKKFLDFILETIARERVESVQGCGRLFFEIVRGVRGVFHSIAGDFLQFLFEALVDERRKDLNQLQLLSDIINYAVINLLNFILPQNMGLFWTKLCAVTKETKNASRLSRLITIYVQTAQHKDGRYMAELDVVVPTILEMIECCDQADDEEALQLLGVLVSKVVLAGSAKTTQLDTCRLLKAMLAVKNRSVFEQFILLITDHVQFDILVLPTLMKYFEVYLDFKAFELLATIVLRKQPLALNATGLENWKPYELQLKKPETSKKLEEKIKKMDFSEENIEENLLFLILVPHLSAIEKTPLPKILKKECLRLMKLLEDQPDVADKSITILSLVVETQIHLKFKFEANVYKQLVDALLPFATKLQALGCLDQLLAQSSASGLSKDTVGVLGQKLAPLLSSHNHNLRLTAAHCLCTLHKSVKDPNPYRTFYDAECIEPNLHNYREQLLLLQRLETSSEFFKSFKNEDYKKDTLHFLLGILYHNFKFVWEPVLKLVEEYAKVMDLQDFWDIYKEKLVDTSEAIEKSYGATEEAAPSLDLWKSSSLNDILENVQVASLTQQELLNYRNLLWLRLPQFGQLSEIKNRDLVTIFLKFVQDEYRSNLENREFTWDLREQSNQPMDEDDSDLEDNEEEKPDKNKRQSLRKRKPKANSSAKSILQTLQSKMGIFVGQPNPKALYREPELFAFWMDLLAGPNAQLQKVALDCVMAYKAKAHTTYRDQLYAIIDEKKFKDELVNFKLDTVNEEYRKQFMHILLRLLYGKMITKGTQRNVGSQVRKGIILRFLGQCSTEEIFWFLQMAFGKYEKYANESVALEEIPSLIAKDFDLSTVWSPKKLQSIVNLLELVRKEFGGLMDMNFQVYMLKLLVFVGSICNEVLRADPTQMHAKMPSVFKNVKNAALQSLVNFFAHIEEFAWKTEQITCLTEVFVWPTIERLPQESIHSPTVLLKLLLQWGEKQQHFKYLNQLHPKEQQTIFHYIIELLLNDRAKPAVRRPILGLIERLLVTAEASKTVPGVDGSCLEIIMTFIPHILKRLKMNFSTRSAKQALDKRDLNILSLLTSHVDEAETCDSLLQLLLPILIAKSQTNATEEVVCQVITTLSNLIKRLDEPAVYLLKIAPLFEQVQEVTARKMLCQLVADIAKKRLKQAKVKDSTITEDQCEQLKELARIMLMMNAWDKRWVEQPDYEKRLDALKEIAKKVDDGSVDMNLGVLVIYNCFYFIKYDKDMGLRDNASEHLKLLVPKLVQKYEDDKTQLNFLVGDVIINLLRRLIRDNNDNVRNEGIKLLGEMARECPQAHEIFTDLAPLADKHDVEVDFFENMTHLQSHRHGRALLKFCSMAETITKTPNARTLTQFVLPLASRYLLSEKHAGKHTLVDAAIDAVGVVCQLLPWQHYHAILRYYLMKMRTTHDHQKQCVRIVVRILDAFHFDLSQSNADEQVLQKLKSELKEKVGSTGDGEPEEAKIVKKEPVVKKSSEDNEDEEDEGEEESPVKEEDNLDNELDEAESDEDDEESPKKATVKLEPILKRPLLLPPNASRRVMSTIATVLIPTLNRSITEKSSYDMKHKVNRKRFSAEREEEEILRVPIALAMVKLMQKLPKELLDTSLPGVFMKVCTFLRSPLKSVRMLTRDILKKIMLTLGASYLSLLMDHLQTLLTRGFQVHVLSVTVHGVLDALRDQLQPEDLENCLSNLLEVAMNDIFGEITAEKEVEKIAAHTPEAKPSAKSYLVLHIAARNIRENCLLDLLMPFKDHLARSHSRKIVIKIQECFAKIVGGLVENPHISRESLLIFIYGTMSESIVDLLPGTQKRVLSEQEKEKMRRARPDCFIIQPAPRHRVGAVNKAVKTNAQANAHILIEFGLEMLDIVLKRKKLVEVDYQPFLNPILPLLRDSLKSTHIRVTTFALKCFSAIWNDEYDLPALGEYLGDVVERMFEILKNFSTFGATKQEDNMQLVKSVYKAIVALLRHCTTYDLTPEQIDQLILHIEQDLYEGENQVMSFSLLKAMVARKVDTGPIHDIMKKISDLSIVSHSDFVRDEARVILITYVMEYSLKKRVDQILKYFSVQLCYKLPTGRQSAIKFLQLVIKKFPQNVLAKRSEFLYLSLGTRLVNDEDPDCRKAVAECIEQLIGRLEKADRQRLFDMTLLFFDVANKPSVREMAAALTSRFLNAEKQSFASRIKLVLPTLVARLTQNNPSAPGRFVKAPSAVGIDVNEDEVGAAQAKRKKVNKKGKPKGLEAEELLVAEEGNEEEIARKQREIDHEIIQMQYCLLKIFEYCSSEILTNDELSHTVDELAYESQRLLAHEHSWVRCNAAKIIGLILASYNFEIVGNRLQDLKKEKPGDSPKLDYIYLNPEYDIKALVLDLCAQMVPGDTPQPMIDEILKIFLLIATMMRDVPFVTKQMLDEQENGDDSEQKTKINLNWLVRNIRFLVNKEVAKAPHCISMRTALFTLIEGLITLLDVPTLEKLAPALLATLVREMSEEDQNVEAELRQQALRVGSKLRKRIGSDIYDKLRTGAQTKLMVRRAERKKVIAQEKVNDPERAAKRRIGAQERKKASKKRKTDVIRGKAEDVKKKLAKRKRKAAEDIF